MLAKVCSNLKAPGGGSPEVVAATLALFQDLSAGYMSGKLLLKLDATAFLLRHHSAEHFPFLAAPENARARTTFYLTLARLLFMDDAPGSFKAFAAPLGAVAAGLAAAARGGADAAALRAAAPRAAAAGLFRDLRGVVAATGNRRTYGQFFDWLYPAYLPTVVCALEAWADAPEVAVPALKFLSELVLNKTQRLAFDASSPNGILLFRELSRALVAYGTRLLAAPPAPGAGGPALYAARYKGAGVALQALARALGGGYVNFGVFELYGDPALRDALDIALRVAVAVPLPDLLAYRKLAKSYYALVETLCLAHAPLLAGRDAPTTAFLVASLDAGLRALDVAVSSQCACALDSLAGFLFRHGPGGEEASAAGAALAGHLAARPDLFPQVLATLFELVLFEDCANQWSLSRPMLSLILVSEGVWGALRARVAAGAPPERRADLAAALDRLMGGVARSLDAKNRDRFTQNLTVARHEWRAGGARPAGAGGGAAAR
jgi:exportin-7